MGKNWLYGVFALLFTVFLIGIVLAEPFPWPEQFYGSVTVNNSSLANGYFLTAKVNGALGAECPIVNGKYGYDKLCILISYQDITPIIFYIGSTEIGRTTFISKNVSTFNFNLNSTLTNYTGNSANGICEVSLGECYFNLLDCDASKTHACAGNGICDTLIGETCSNAPQDCGACPSSSSSSSGSSSGGGGGGGGGSSHSSVVKINTSQENNSIIRLGNPEVINNKNQTNQTSTSSGFSDFVGGIGSVLVITIIVLFAIIIYMSYSKRNSDTRRIKRATSDIKIVKMKRKGDEVKSNP
jgi:hypothetical protein